MTSISPTSFREYGLGVACALLIAGGHLAFGALTAETALALAAIWAVLFLACAFMVEQPRLQSARPLLAPAACFMLVIAFALASLTNWIPGTAQPVWAQAGLPASASIDPAETRLEIVKLLGLICVFGVAWLLGLSRSSALISFKTLVYFGAAFGVAVICLHIHKLAPTTQAGRLEATFMNPNTAGTVAGALLCLAVGLAARSLRHVLGDRASIGRRLGLVMSVIAVIILATTLWMTHSRGAIGATIAALAAFALARAITQRWSLLQSGLGMAAVAGAAFAIFRIPSVAERLSTSRADAMLRREIFDTGWASFEKFPWLGYGLGNYDVTSRLALTPDSYPLLWNIRAAENVYLQWLIEAGLLGALAMFAAVAAIVVTTSFQTVRRRSMLGPLHALIAADIVFILHGALDFALQNYSVAIFWTFLLGLQLSWSGSSTRPGAAR